MKQKSLRQLSKELGVSASYLSQVQNGRRPASEKLLSNHSFKVLSSVKQNVKHQVDTSIVEKLQFKRAGESSSGRTADSGSVSEGSNPSSPATVSQWRIRLAAQDTSLSRSFKPQSSQILMNLISLPVLN